MSSPVLWYATRALGISALVLLTVAVAFGVLTATRVAGARWPRVATQDLHRRLSMLAVAFVAGHVLTSVMDSFVHIGWAAVVVPFASPYKRWWVALGTVSLDLFLAVVVTSLLRSRIPARLWRGVHWLTYAGWGVAVVHTLGAGTDMRLSWARELTVACIATVGVAATARLLHSATERRRMRRLVSGLEGRFEGAGAFEGTGDRRRAASPARRS